MQSKNYRLITLLGYPTRENSRNRLETYAESINFINDFFIKTLIIHFLTQAHVKQICCKKRCKIENSSGRGRGITRLTCTIHSTEH